MEEVPTHVNPGPIVSDVLTRQHEHRSGLIWNGDHETQLCTAPLGGARQIGGALVIIQIWVWSRIPVLWPQLMTDVQADPRAPLGAISCTSFDCSQMPTHTLFRGNDHTYWGTQHASTVEASMLQEVDDMASVMIQEPPSFLSQMAIFAKKVQTIIWRCTVSIGVKWGALRQPGCGVGSGRPPVPPFPSRHGHADPEHIEVERGEGSGGGRPLVDPFDSSNLDILSFSLGLTPPSQSLPGGYGTLRAPPYPGLGFAPFHSPHHTSLGFSSFRAPPPSGTADLHRISLYHRHLHLMKRN
ncbi:hypothetical protein M9H77_24292 [Catharanthus roseus]|uniref:Uncharacterized protein n=1 Tax=Catharanthus roseus TaxID=4058 RepID=A0ACC0AWP2_CATRO|nr:hypothetical protein M9H77_24292 [Catharanthus roseus]